MDWKLLCTPVIWRAQVLPPSSLRMILPSLPTAHSTSPTTVTPRKRSRVSMTGGSMITRGTSSRTRDSAVSATTTRTGDKHRPHSRRHRLLRHFQRPRLKRTASVVRHPDPVHGAAKKKPPQTTAAAFTEKPGPGQGHPGGHSLLHHSRQRLGSVVGWLGVGRIDVKTGRSSRTPWRAGAARPPAPRRSPSVPLRPSSHFQSL